MTACRCFFNRTACHWVLLYALWEWGFWESGENIYISHAAQRWPPTDLWRNITLMQKLNFFSSDLFNCASNMKEHPRKYSMPFMLVFVYKSATYTYLSTYTHAYICVCVNFIYVYIYTHMHNIIICMNICN